MSDGSFDPDDFFQPEWPHSDDGGVDPFAAARDAADAQAALVGEPKLKSKRADGNPAKDWCITAKSVPSWVADGRLPDGVDYYCGQRERGEGGFEHYQCFIQLSSRKRFSYVKIMWGDPSIHCESRKGTPQQARDYCRKSDTAVAGTFVELGKLRGLKKNHMDELKDAIDAGATAGDLMDEHWSAWTRSMVACDRAIQRRDQGRAGEWVPPVVRLFWGPTRTGKTRRAFEYVARDHAGVAYRKPQGVWWDGYDNQACVVLDDYDGDVPIGQLLQLLDGRGHGLLLPVKGSHVQVKAKTFFFTSNKPLSKWYPQATQEQLDALEARFTSIEYMAAGDPHVKIEPVEVIDLD